MKFIHKCYMFIPTDDSVDTEYNSITVDSCLCETIQKRRSTDRVVSNSSILKVYIPFKELNRLGISPLNEGVLKPGNLVLKGLLSDDFSENRTFKRQDILNIGARIITSILVYDFGTNSHVVLICE